MILVVHQLLYLPMNILLIITFCYYFLKFFHTSEKVRIKEENQTHIHCFFIHQDFHKVSDNVAEFAEKNLRDLGNSTTFFKQSIFNCMNSQPAASNSHASPSGCIFIFNLIQSNSRRRPEGVDPLSPCFSDSSLELNLVIVQLFSGPPQLSLRAGNIQCDKQNSGSRSSTQKVM